MEKFSLLIVEDEVRTREGLTDSVNWRSFGISLVEAVATAEEALRVLAEHDVDIVLTDIVMPGIDGLELAKIIRERYPDTRIVLISGYGDAENLRSAIRVDVVEFVFKPVDLDELCAAVKKAVSWVQRERNQKKLIDSLQTRLKNSLPVLRDRFFFELVNGIVSREDEIRSRCDFLALSLPADRWFWVFSLRTNGAEFPTFDAMDAFISVEMVRLAGERFVYSFPNESRESVVIVQEDTQVTPRDAVAFVRRLRSSVALSFGFNLGAGVGNCFPGFSGIPLSYEQSRDALSIAGYLGHRAVVHYNDSGDTLHGHRAYSAATVAHLLNAVRRADKAQSLKVFDAFVDQARTNPAEGLGILMQLCRDFLVAIRPWAAPSESGTSTVDDAAERDVLARLGSIEAVRNWFDNVIDRVIDNVVGEREKSTHRTAHTVRLFLESNFSDPDVSVQSVATRLGLTPNYLSLVFKKATGITFTEYLTTLRVAAAQELLRDPKRRPADVASAVGYPDTSYFGRVFKKHTGFTPSQFAAKGNQT